MFVSILDESAIRCQHQSSWSTTPPTSMRQKQRHTEKKSRAFSNSCSSYAFSAAAQVSNSALSDMMMMIDYWRWFSSGITGISVPDASRHDKNKGKGKIKWMSKTQSLRKHTQQGFGQYLSAEAVSLILLSRSSSASPSRPRELSLIRQVLCCSLFTMFNFMM